MIYHKLFIHLLLIDSWIVCSFNFCKYCFVNIPVHILWLAYVYLCPIATIILCKNQQFHVIWNIHFTFTCLHVIQTKPGLAQSSELDPCNSLLMWSITSLIHLLLTVENRSTSGPAQLWRQVPSFYSHDINPIVESKSRREKYPLSLSTLWGPTSSIANLKTVGKETESSQRG